MSQIEAHVYSFNPTYTTMGVLSRSLWDLLSPWDLYENAIALTIRSVDRSLLSRLIGSDRHVQAIPASVPWIATLACSSERSVTDIGSKVSSIEVNFAYPLICTIYRRF